MSTRHPGPKRSDPLRTCPVCERALAGQSEHIPFCSKRCKDVDLNRWLSGGYAIAGNQAGDDSEGIEAREPFDQEPIDPSRKDTQH